MSKNAVPDPGGSTNGSDGTEKRPNDDVTDSEAELREVDFSRDALFKVLSNRRRRYTLHHLEQEGVVDIGSLSEQVAAWENEKPVNTVSSAERKNVYTSLQQHHLPKMDADGLVEFDDRSGEIELGPAVEEYDLYMEVVDDSTVPWSHYYAGIAGLQCLFLAAAYADVLPISGFELGALLVTMLGVSALAHTYYTRTEMRLGTGERPPETDR